MVMPPVHNASGTTTFNVKEITMIQGNKNIVQYDRHLSEYYDVVTALFHQECEIYELVDFFIRERTRLMNLVLEARGRANDIAPCHGKAPYPEIGERLYNACFDDHPAMNRYYELYDGEPF